MNSAEEEDVTIEDVVDCRIILVRQVGEPPERPPPNNSNAPKVEFSFVDLTGDDSEEEIDSDFNNEDDVMGEKKECQTLGVKAATCSIPAPTISSLIATSNHCGESCDNDADGAGTQNLIERGELVSEAEAEDCDAKLDSAAATITPENGSANDVLLSEGAGVPNCRQEEGIQSDTNNRRCAQHGLNKDDKRKTTQRGITTDIKHAGGIERRINLDDKEVDADDRKDSDSRQSLDPSNGKNTLACQNGSTGTRTDASNEHHIGVCESVQIGSTNQIPQEKCGLERAHATESTISMSSGSAEHGSAKMPIDDSGMIVEATAYTQIANSHEAREVADCSFAVDDDAMKGNTMVSDHGPAVCSKEDIKVDMDHVTHDSSNDIIEIIDESDSEIDEANVEDDDDSDDDFESENGKDKSNYPTKENSGGIERRINLDDKEVDGDDRKDSDSRQSLDPSNGKNTLSCQNGSTGTRTDASNEHHIGVCESVQIGSTNQIPQEKCGLERAHATESTISMSSGSAEHGSAKMPIDDSGMIVEATAYTQIANSHEAREVADCSFAVDDDAMKGNTMVSDHGPAVCSKEDIKVDMDHVTHDSSNDIIEIIDESDSEIDEANVEDDDDSDDDFESENGKDKSNDKSNYPTKEHSTTEGNGKAACDAPSHKEAEPCIEILDDSDDNEIEIVGVSIPEKIKLGRKRKLEEMKKAEAVNFILERSMRQAKMKQTKMTTEKTMYVNKRRRQDSSSQPNFTFYDGNKKNHTSTNTPKTNKETHWRFKYNYNEEAALEEQERLLRESVARVKAQGGIERLLQISTPKASGGQLYTQPVKDVSTLPNNHFKWKDPYSRLGVPRKSRYEIVKRNYRKLCLLYHPDKSHYKESQDRFQAIKEAYEEIKESLGL